MLTQLDRVTEIQQRVKFNRDRDQIIKARISDAKVAIISQHVREGEIGCVSCGHVDTPDEFRFLKGIHSWPQKPDRHYCQTCNSELEFSGWIDQHGHYRYGNPEL